MELIDISAPLSDDVQDYIPGVTYTRTRPIFTLEQHGVESHEIVLSTLSGTYFETGRHVRPDAITVDQVPVETFIGPAVVVDVGVKEPAAPIERSEVERYAGRIRPGDAVIVRTHWDRMWNTDAYFARSPFFTREAFEWLLEQEIRLLAADIPSYDNQASPQGLIRRLFATGSTFLLAPLVNLARIEQERVTLFAFPLKVKGVSGAPARVLVSAGRHAGGVRV